MDIARIKYVDCGDSALMVHAGETASTSLSRTLRAVAEALNATQLAGVVDVIPALSSLMVQYDPIQLPRSILVETISQLCEVTAAAGKGDAARHWRIPVCYEADYGLDLDELAGHLHVRIEDIADLHCAQTYTVYMMGFLPGFPYMGDVPDRLQRPRRAEPRIRVPAGSVAMASSFTGIYPVESPGGWHIIGRTPLSLWRLPHQVEPMLKPGDVVDFKPISAREYEDIVMHDAGDAAPFLVYG
jgi:KipI family sensor histidine kinase inhibitor